MKKTYEIQDLDCAHCAAKIEAAISQIEGVESVNVNFIMQKLTLEASDDIFDCVLKKAIKLCRRIEPDMSVII